MNNTLIDIKYGSIYSMDIVSKNTFTSNLSIPLYRRHFTSFGILTLHIATKLNYC